MASKYMRILQDETGFSEKQLVKKLGLDTFDKESIANAIAELDSVIETCVLSEIDIFIARKQNDMILIRYLSDYDFALYEPDLFNILKCSTIHKAFITRTKRAIERIAGKVLIVFMDSNYYETWLGVNDFDDSPEIRMTWARQQVLEIK